MSNGKEEQGKRRLALLVPAVLACLFLGAALLTFDAGDWPSPHQYPHNSPTVNACGPVGAFAAYHLRRLFGTGAYLLLLITTIGAFIWLGRGRIVRLWQRVLGLVLLVGGCSAAADMVLGPGASTLAFGPGGLVGAALGGLMKTSFSGIGSVLVLGYAAIVGLILVAEGWVFKLPRLTWRALGAVMAAGRVVAARARPAPAAAVAATGEAGAGGGTGGRQAIGASSGEDGLKINRPSARAEAASGRPPEQLPLFDVNAGGQPATSKGADVQQAERERQRRRARRERRTQREQRSTGVPAPAKVPVAKGGTSQGGQLHAVTATSPPVAASKRAYPRRLAEWKLPPLSILDSVEYRFSAAQETALRAKAKTLETALQEFRLDARVVEIDTGPVITMFELELAPGIKVSRVAALANDMARALKAPAVRIVAPLPGKSTIGIEVPNIDKERVRLKELLLSAGDRIKEMAVPLFLGKDASGHTLVMDLASMPHLLIAGTTGSGKSVAINSIIASVLMSRRPDMVKLILIDPKMVELSHFKDVPHLMSPIVTETQRAEQVLDWAVAKMEERYALFAEARVRNIAGYNRLGADEVYRRLQPSNESEKEQIPAHLPYVVIIVDELADLMMTSAREVEHHLSRLAQKSRAVGVHIIVATQRPEAKVVTGLIKSNLPCRCAFRVASRMDSRIVLDQNGAEVLMGQGDMLFLPPGSHKPVRAQGTYVEDHELQALIKFLNEQGRPEYHPELVRARRNGEQPSERDPLFEQAVEIILETGRGSVSLLQRRLMVGYSRASRLIDQMAEAGIVGDYKGSQAREVVITPEQWTQMKKEADADMATDSSNAFAETATSEATGNAVSVVARGERDRWRGRQPDDTEPVAVPMGADDDEEELWEDDLDDDLDDDDDDDDDDEDDDLDLDDEDEDDDLDDDLDDDDDDDFDDVDDVDNRLNREGRQQPGRPIEVSRHDPDRPAGPDHPTSR